MDNQEAEILTAMFKAPRELRPEFEAVLKSYRKNRRMGAIADAALLASLTFLAFSVWFNFVR